MYGCALRVASFVRVRLVRPDALSGSLGSLGFVSFVWVSLGGHRLHSGSSRSSVCALGVSGFIVRVRQVCAVMPSGSQVSFGFVWFFLVHPAVAGFVRFRLVPLGVTSRSLIFWGG